MIDATDRIPFNRPHLTGFEFAALAEAAANGHLSGNGAFAQRCAAWLNEELSAPASFIVPSCTAALEMAMLLAEIGPGDEVIMPSFTFVSCANAVALRGGVPVFADIRPDTLNLSPEAVEAAMTERTKAVIVVHYAGVGAEVEALAELCARRGVMLVEDAAHAVRASRGGRPLGSFAAVSAFSFHETKNLHCGEGGALVVNDPALVDQAHVLQEKGTNRRRFLDGHVDKYTWVDVGSSFLMSDVSAAFLWSQMQHAQRITQRRLAVWQHYQESFADLEADGLLQRPVVPDGCEHNAHLYALRLPDRAARDRFIAELGSQNVQSVFHYVPLHDSPAGLRLGRVGGPLDVTVREAGRVARLPVWVDLTHAQVERVVRAVQQAVAAPRFGQRVTR
ncbi:MAG: dTDP-4-amino-4,6-dideoxygalactose transaminase [Solirubrobacteraceae bacterium]|jgi:dTDP-4-amino-4,6-dideoxygalactose transaminase|nr:dTDP-4-amino-4,6-dideoxygalactose transaminase [Solirubrobacteraceae bacterium]